MILSSEFLKIVSEGNINRIRTQIYTSFTVAPKSNEGEEMVKYAEENIGNALYKEQDNQKLDLNAANWTEEYYKQLLKDLMFNFSRERINLLIKVRKHLFAGKTEKSAFENKKNKESVNKSSVRFEKGNNNRNNSLNYKQTGMVVAGVGGALLLGGIVAKSFVIGAVGGAALIAGGIILLNEKN